MPKHRRNASPPPPPARRPEAPPPQRVSTSLARVRQLAGSVNERERPFDPSRRGTWQGSSRDLVVNGGGIYKGTGLQKNDFVIYRGRTGWRVDMITSANGNHLDVTGDNRGYTSADRAFIHAAEEHHKRSMRGQAAIYVQDGEEYRPYKPTNRYMPLTRNGSVDPRDIPAHLHGAELREEPEHNGQDVGYSQGMRGRSAEWFQVEYATGSDYNGGSVHESNYQVLSELLEEHHPEDSEPVVWARTSGGHGTYGVVVRYGDLEDEVREAIDALEDYPLMDEEHHSHLEMEQQDEAWDDWARKDFIKAVAKNNNKEWTALKEAISIEDWHLVFHAAAESANIYWEDRNGEGQWIDVDHVAKELETFINRGAFPKHSSDAEDDALQRLYDALPGVEEE